MKNRLISAITAVLIVFSMTACSDAENVKENTAKTEVIETETDIDHDASETESEEKESGVSPLSKTENVKNTETSVKTESKSETKTTETSKSNRKKSDDKKNDSKTDDKKKTETESNNNIDLKTVISNQWNDGKNDFYQIDMTVTNKSKKKLDGWTITLDVDSSTKVDQSWSCENKLSDSVMTFSPVDYNKTIEAGQDITFGFIIKTAKKPDVKTAKLTIGELTVSATVGQNNNNNNNNNGNDRNNNGERTAVSDKEIPKPTTDDWLFTDGSNIVDSNGKKVWLTGVNWFGYNTGTNTFDGLWACDLNSSLDAIADRGFNLLRVPISAELIDQWAEGEYPTANFNQAENSYLVGMNSLEIFDYVVDRCRADGIKIMIDIHSAETNASGHNVNVWYTQRISEKDYLNALSWMAKRYKNDDTIIAYDLKNEPHGKANENPRAKWDGSKDADNWKYIAEKASLAVLKANPNVLVMVEGTEIYPKNGSYKSTDMNDYYCTWWGGNLRGVSDYPVDLGKYQNKLVYSPHDYGPTVYKQPWFNGSYSFDSLYKDVWYDNWFYIQDKNIAPLLIGEWGGYMSDPNITWMTYLRQLIKKNKISHTFWCFNSNSGDTGGLVKDDFKTWDEEKYEFVEEVLWKENGKFVGLDHQIPLGENGITLEKAKGLK